MADILNERGYVVYSKNWKPEFEKTSYWGVYWEKIREEKEKQERKLFIQVESKTSFNNLNRIGDELITLGKQERAKEMQLIYQVTGRKTTQQEEIEFVRTFNEVLNGAKAYKRALDQLTMAKDVAKTQKLAPTISSLFLPKFKKFLHNDLKNLIFQHQEEILNGDISFWENNYEQVVKDCMERALRIILTTTSKSGEKDIYGTYYKHLDLYKQYLKGGDYEKNHFLEVMGRTLGLDKIEKLVEKNLDTIKKNLISKKSRDKFGTSAMVDAIYTKQQVGQIGGSLNEFLTSFRLGLPNEIIIGDGSKKYRKASEVAKNKVQIVDNYTIFSANTEVDVEKLVRQMNEELDKSTSIPEAEKQMRAFWERHLKGLDDTFVIFTSNKAYSFNSVKQHGFEGGKNRNIGLLGEVLSQSQYFYSKQKVEEFIEVVANAMPGAVLEGDQGDIKTYLRNSIYSSIAYLLFDSWFAIGKQEVGDPKAIHAFSLDDIQVPLSFLLIGIGNAIKDATALVAANQWFQVSIKYPDWVKYKTSSDYPITVHTNGKEEADVVAAWEEQREDARKSITFSYTFFHNFWKTVVDELRKLK